MKAVDTSVVVAGFASWHEYHEPARSVLDGGAGLIEHCAQETYSVLTRLPPPHRCSGSVVRDFLRARFPRPFLRLDIAAYRDFVLRLPDREISGGAAYDALVAATAVHCGAELVTCDRRAGSVYDRYGVRTTFLA
ncbi:MAG: type II toxin-antitoxin system VapC family toxin [bacterium]